MDPKPSALRTNRAPVEKRGIPKKADVSSQNSRGNFPMREVALFEKARLEMARNALQCGRQNQSDLTPKDSRLKNFGTKALPQCILQINRSSERCYASL